MSENAEQPARSGRGTGEKERPTITSVLIPAAKRFKRIGRIRRFDDPAAAISRDRDNTPRSVFKIRMIIPHPVVLRTHSIHPV